jgi:hypothetical protein
MANFEADFRTYLMSNPPVAGGNTTFQLSLQTLYGLIGDRIHPLRIEQSSELPAAAYQINAREPFQTQDGSADLYQRKVQVDFVTRTYAQLVELCDALVGSLHNFSGLMGNTEVDQVAYENSEQGFDDVATVFFMTVSFNIIYKP